MLKVGEDAVEQQTSDLHSYTRESESESIMISRQRGLPISPGFSDRPPPTVSFLDIATVASEDSVSSVHGTTIKRQKLLPPSGSRSPPPNIYSERPSLLFPACSESGLSVQAEECSSNLKYDYLSSSSEIRPDTDTESSYSAGSTLPEAIAAGMIQPQVEYKIQPQGQF